MPRHAVERTPEGLVSLARVRHYGVARDVECMVVALGENRHMPGQPTKRYSDAKNSANY